MRSCAWKTHKLALRGRPHHLLRKKETMASIAAGCRNVAEGRAQTEALTVKYKLFRILNASTGITLAARKAGRLPCPNCRLALKACSFLRKASDRATTNSENAWKLFAMAM